jgi:hypothetical protein
MIKKFLNWLKKAITPHRQKDEHLEFYEDKVEPDVPMYVEETAKQKKIRLKHKGDIK